MQKDNKQQVQQVEVEEATIESILSPAERMDKILEQTNINKKEKERIKTDVLVMIKQQEYFEGPLPPPVLFEKYEKVLPGSADRIIKMAENQQEHRIQLEKMVIGSQQISNQRGQLFGFIIFIVGLLVAVAFAILGMKTFAGILATTTLVTIVGLFLNANNIVKSDLKIKEQDKIKGTK